MASTFADLFARHVGAATARQLALGDVLGKRSWAVDISKGTATFDELSFPIQLLGTEANGDKSWLWAWANEASSLPESLLKSANKLRAMGRDQGPEFLVTRGFSLDDMSGHQVAIVCTGLLGTGPYYRGPYDGGALYFTVENVALSDVDGPRISTVLTQVISSFSVDHRLATRNFLLDLGYTLDETSNQTRGLKTHGATVSVDFDAAGRISNLAVSIAPR